MKIENISKNIPISPSINEDGWYAQCKRCWNEVEPHNNICPYCHQVQDWTWMNNKGGESYE